MEIKLESIAPNASINKWYREQLYAMIKEMRLDIIQSVVRPYRADLAMDGITDWIGSVLDKLISKWQTNLANLSKDVAKDFVGRSRTHYDKRLHNMLKKRGFIVNFRNSRYVEEQAQIAIGENVALIKSIGNQYLDNVRAAVWRSVKGGYDLESLVKQLMQIDGVTERRAKNIARDQTAKANQAFEKGRALELGITHAIWRHSAAGREPRPSHVKANGTKYELAKECFIDNEYIQVSEKINCRCRAQLVIEIPDGQDGLISSLN